MEQGEAGKPLIEFTDDDGVPETLPPDGASEFTGWNTEFVKHARQMRMQIYNLEQGMHNQNHAADDEIWFIAK